MPAPAGLFVGLATLDVVQLIDAMTRPDEKIRGTDDMLAAGGPATNAAVAFARCGGAATLVTRVPDGPAWDLMRGDLEAHGVDVLRAPTAQGRRVTVASILVTRATGERAVVSTGDRTHAEPGVSPDPTSFLETIDPAAYSVMLCDGHEADLAIPLAARAREAGVPVVLDGGSWKPTTPELLRHVDAAVVSAAFRPDGGSDVLAHLAEAGVRFGAVTRGASSILYRTPAGDGELPVEPVSGVVDTLGAGDFFHGGFAHHVAGHGLRDEESLRAALRFGAKVAGESIRSFGTRAWLG